MATFGVVAELKDGAARKITLEMLAEARRLADASGSGDVSVVALGPLASGEAERLASHGADRILHVEGESLAGYSTEAYTAGVQAAVECSKPDTLFFGATAEVRRAGGKAGPWSGSTCGASWS